MPFATQVASITHGCLRDYRAQIQMTQSRSDRKHMEGEKQQGGGEVKVGKIRLCAWKRWRMDREIWVFKGLISAVFTKQIIIILKVWQSPFPADEIFAWNDADKYSNQSEAIFNNYRSWQMPPWRGSINVLIIAYYSCQLKATSFQPGQKITERWECAGQRLLFLNVITQERSMLTWKHWF